MEKIPRVKTDSAETKLEKYLIFLCYSRVDSSDQDDYSL